MGATFRPQRACGILRVQLGTACLAIACISVCTGQAVEPGDGLPEQDEAAEPGPCLGADLLAESGLLDSAERVYLTMVGSQECARAGLSTLRELRVSQLLAAADRYLEIENFDGAITAFNDAIAQMAGPSRSEATSGLTRARTGKRDVLMDIGAAYEATGDYSSAAGKYAEAIALAPTDELNTALQRVQRLAISSKAETQLATGDYKGATATLVGSEVDARALAAELANTSPTLRARWVLARVLAWLETGLYAAVGALLIVFLYAFTRRFLRQALVIEPFSEDGLSRKIGNGFTLALEGELARLMAHDTEALGGMRVESPVLSELSMPTEVAKSLPNTIGWLGAIPNLMAQILARRTLRVAGALHYSSTRGAGASVRVAKAGSVIANETFWQFSSGSGKRNKAEQPDESAFLRVAAYAAIWVAFRIGRGQNNGFKLLGTGDWRAYVAFQRGVDAENDQDIESARNRYVQALKLDPDMQCARYNRARLAPEAKYAQTLDAVKRAADNSDITDPTHFKARYTLAFRYYVTGHKQKALEEANTLYEELRSQLFAKNFLGKGHGPKNEVFRSFLVYVYYGFSVPLKTGLELELNDDTGTLAEAERAYEKTATGHASYMYGCVYSQAAGVVKNKPANASSSSQATGKLQDQGGKLHSRHEYLELSLSALEVAVHFEPSLAKVVAKDPTLDEVRHADDIVDGRVVKDRFREIWDKNVPIPPKSTTRDQPLLAQIRDIGNKHAAALAARKILTTDDLILAARTDAKRRDIATALGVPAPQVLRWAQTADLMRIVGIEFVEANLLNAAGVYCTTDLAGADAAQLIIDMQEWNASFNYPETPEPGTVLQWIKDARSMPPGVNTS